MGWFDKLKALINIEFNKPLINVNVTRNSDNNLQKKKYIYDSEKKQLNLHYDLLSNEEKTTVAEVFRERLEEGKQILENKTSNLLEELLFFQKNKGTNEKILEFFKPIIPPDDLEALECSLYLRDAFLKGKNVSLYKEDIRKRFGDRGNNIANLCTAGYFEGFLMPLYNNFQSQFNELYGVIVGKSVLAIFVHSQMTELMIKNEFKHKMELSKKYGLKFIHIHGIGEGNIKTIKKCIDENKEIFQYYNKKIIEQTGIMIVELLL